VSQNLTRKAAAEFSFFLAVPTMFAATAYKLFKLYHSGGGIPADKWTLLLIGNAVAFVVALLAIKFFISLLTKYGFKYFGYYRIVLGLAILFLYFFGIPLQII
jgi:undecaprenyl-diphosphatase